MTPHSPNKGLILLVDDTPTNLELLVDCLSDHGFEVMVAMDGETALNRSQRVLPDLILLDVKMPGIDGYETCRRFKENESTKDIPVIFMTAISEPGSAVTGFSAGAVDYVTKPLHLEEVIARVTTHLRIRHMQIQLESTIANLQQEVAERKHAEKALSEAMVFTQKANDRMRMDLEAAARVQHALLPETLPAIPGASFAWVYRPCAELGGDSLNVFQLDPDKRYVGMYVLDVSGHGVPASLLSVTLSGVLTPRHDPSCLFTRLDLLTGEGSLASPADIATKLNHMFPMSEEAKQYFTLIFGILDTQEKTFRYVCAGHPPPILFAKGHQPIVCEGRSLPIGLFEDEQYEESTIVLEPGDRIYLYSDGVLEAMNDKREIFNETRLQTTIENTRPAGLEDSVNSIVKAVHRWNGGHQVHDDLSILAVELK